jgi:hypothetical protein
VHLLGFLVLVPFEALYTPNWSLSAAFTYVISLSVRLWLSCSHLFVCKLLPMSAWLCCLSAAWGRFDGEQERPWQCCAIWCCCAWNGWLSHLRAYGSGWSAVLGKKQRGPGKWILVCFYRSRLVFFLELRTFTMRPCQFYLSHHLAYATFVCLCMSYCSHSWVMEQPHVVTHRLALMY